MSAGNFLRPRWRKVLADLWASKTRTLLVVASIAVGVFAIGTIAATYVIFSQDINVSYAQAQPANIEIVTDAFDDAFVHSVARMPGVADAEGRHVMTVRVSRDGRTWQNLAVVANKDFVGSDINLLEPIAGTGQPADHQILVRQDMMNDTGLQVGDVAHIQLPNGETRDLDVVGLVGDQAAAGDFMSPPRAYTTLDTVPWLGDAESYNRLYVRVSAHADDEAAIQTIADAVEAKIEKSGRQVYQTSISKTNEHPLAYLALAMLGVLGALGVLIMLLSSSLIVNTLNALLVQHLRQIGVMKLVGARSFQISGMYILLILAYGFIALLIAVPAGVVAGYQLAEFIAGFMSAKLQGFRVVPLAIGLQVALALFIPLAAGFFPVRRGAKTTVRRAISHDGLSGQGSTAVWLERLGAKLMWVERPLILSIRNTFRRKGRLALTLFTLTMAGAIFIAVFNVRVSLNHFRGQLAQHFMADVMVTFERPYRLDEVEHVVMQVPGVKYVEGWSGAGAEIVDANDNVIENVQLVAPPVTTELLKPDMLDGRWLRPDDGKALVLSDSIWSELPNLQAGDTVRISIQGRRAEEWPVVGIFRFTDMFGDTLGYASYDVISELLDTPGQAASYRVVADESTLARQEQVSAGLDAYFRALDFRVSDIEAGLVTQKQSSQAMNILITFLVLMALLTAFVGSIGLTGTMGMNVLERTREIGVMRAIGAVDLEIIKSVVVEGVLIGLISWAAAVVLSFPISFMLLRIISEAMINASMPLAFSLWGFVIWLAVVIALSVVASMWPARSAARLTIREVLAYE